MIKDITDMADTQSMGPVVGAWVLVVPAVPVPRAASLLRPPSSRPRASCLSRKWDGLIELTSSGPFIHMMERLGRCCSSVAWWDIG
jgi:hypothetical protein